MKSMQKKQWKKNQNKELIVGPCKWCEKEIVNTDAFVLVLVSLPILVLVYSIFTDDPEIRARLDMFFEYFKQLPYWYQAIFIGIVSAIYGLKGADIMRKPK